MSVQEKTSAVRELIDSLINDPDATVEEIGTALAAINDHIVVNWKRAHRIRQAEANAVEPSTEG